MRSWGWSRQLGQELYTALFASLGKYTRRWAITFASLVILPRLGIDVKEGEDGELAFVVVPGTEVVHNDQHASFALLKIFRQFYKGKKPAEADYGRFTSRHWGILFAYSDIFRDIVIPEWNR